MNRGGGDAAVVKAGLGGGLGSVVVVVVAVDVPVVVDTQVTLLTTALAVLS